MRCDYALGYDDDGVIQGYKVAHLVRCGYSADLSQGVVDRTMFHSDNAYYLPAVRIDTRRLKTNTVSNTAFRGFGGPQGMLSIERVMDEIAWATGRDPLDVRLANLYAAGRDITPLWPEGRGSADHACDDRRTRRKRRLPRAPGRDRGLQRVVALPEEGDRAHAGEVRHQLHP